METLPKHGTLPFEDFMHYGERTQLGDISFLNGYCYTADTSPGAWIGKGGFVSFFASLQALYQLLDTWQIEQKPVLDKDNIVGMLSFGSAVRVPGYTEVPVFGKKYVLFGENVQISTKRDQIQPNDADFLVLTRRNHITNLHIPANRVHSCRMGKVDDMYGKSTHISQGGIHLVTRGVEQLYEGIKSEQDPISLESVRDGVPIVGGKALEDVIASCGVNPNNTLNARWGYDADARVHCRFF